MQYIFCRNLQTQKTPEAKNCGIVLEHFCRDNTHPHHRLHPLIQIYSLSGLLPNIFL